MFFKSTSFSALVAVTTVLTQASLSVIADARAHPHWSRRFRHSDIRGRDTTAGTVPVPVVELQQLQSQYTTFHEWTQAWLSSANAGDPSAIAQFKNELTAYDGWINYWLNSTLPGSVTPSAAPSGQAQSQSPASSPPSAVPSVASTPPAQMKNAVPNYAQPATSVAAGAPKSSPPALPPAQPTAPVAEPSSSVANSAQTSQIPSGSSGGSGGNPKAASGKSLAVYWGASAASGSLSLGSLCQDKNIDIVILAFLDAFNGGSTHIAVGNDCSGTQSCPTLANDIAICQGLSKKVMLSIGGAAAASLSFTSDDQAKGAANTLWNSYGGGTGGSRPFGDIKLDGFDIDSENKITTGWTAFVTALRSAMSQDKSRQYYISGAPQCPIPDASIPLDAMKQMDMVWVQFYNNPGCNIGTTGFLDSFKQWSAQLGSGPKLYIGAPGASPAGSGYLEPAAMATAIQGASKAGINNFGGVMLWDGPLAKNNAAGGKTYLDVVKGAL